MDACTWSLLIPSFKLLSTLSTFSFLRCITCLCFSNLLSLITYFEPLIGWTVTSLHSLKLKPPLTGLKLNLASRQNSHFHRVPTAASTTDSRQFASMAFKLFALSVTLLSNVAFAAPTSKQGCGRVHIMCARGTSQAPGVGSIGEVADQIKLFATEAIISAVPYPASETNPVYLDSVKLGATHLQSMIKNTVAECPDVRIVLLGYSQV